jgi:hypothetical protein
MLLFFVVSKMHKMNGWGNRERVSAIIKIELDYISIFFDKQKRIIFLQFFIFYVTTHIYITLYIIILIKHRVLN